MTQPITAKKQQCQVMGLILSWVGYLAGLAYMGYEHHGMGALAWLVVVPSIRWALFRYFPSISRFLGYGTVSYTHLDVYKRQEECRPCGRSKVFLRTQN